MKKLLFVLKLVPTLISAVQAAERLVPLPQQGAAKLNFVLGIIEDSYSGAAKILPLVTSIITRIVALANNTGSFGSEEDEDAPTVE